MAENVAKIPLWLAVLVNVNAVVGGAFFITAPPISAAAGYFAPFAWLLGALAMMPIALIFARFARSLPLAGGIYVYAKEAFGRPTGFITGWMYFIGNSAGNALFVYAFCETVLNIPIFYSVAAKLGITQLGLGIIVTACLIFLSMGNEHLLQKTQLLLSWLKLIPFALIFFGLFKVAKLSNFTAIPPQPGWITSVFPMVLFSYLGIEACSSIAHTIKDASKNVARATYISLAVVTVIYALSHGFLHLEMGSGCFSADSFARLGWILGNNFNPQIADLFYNLVVLAIGVSYLGGAYSLLNTDCWLLHSMANDFNGPVQSFFLQLNRYGQPKNCLFLQGFLLSFFLIFANSAQWMTIASVVGALLAFTTIVLAYIKIFEHRRFLGSMVVGLISVGVMGLIVIKEVASHGIFEILPLLVIIGIGMLLQILDKNS